jgi:hypothetical protein
MIVYNGLRYMLCNRYCIKDSSLIESIIKQIFQILKIKRMMQVKAKKSYSSKLALLIIQVINDYNYNMNGVDLIDQYKKECSII